MQLTARYLSTVRSHLPENFTELRLLVALAKSKSRLSEVELEFRYFRMQVLPSILPRRH